MTLIKCGLSESEKRRRRLMNRIYLECCVINPITRKLADTNEFVTTYAVYIETNDTAFTMSKSMVRRRYSEFTVLRALLSVQHPSVIVPKLPGRTYLGKRFDQGFIQDRCHALQIFLKSIIEQPVFLSNKSLHMFLQSSLPMERVRELVVGCTSFELPRENAPLVLCPVENGNIKLHGRVGILKQESCASLALASDTEHECSIRKKHQHIRVGSGIIVCPYVPGEQQALAGSVPLNVPGIRESLANARNCASDTCLDGATSNASSVAGSKKKVSFFIEKENKQNLMQKVVETHSSSQEISK